MWEEIATIKRQSDDSTVDQNNWDSSPTNPQDDILTTTYSCSIRTTNPNGEDSGQGFNVQGDAVIVGENTIDIQEGDEIIINSSRKFKVVSKPIPLRNWLRMEVERL